jgi:predicted nuclease of predicted toxin-antitoxin system
VKIKTDENIGKRAIEFLRVAGHDVITVREQNLAGGPDEAVFNACRAERRILITLDRDFGEPLRFPSGQSAGVVILELSAPASLQMLLDRIHQFMTLAATRAVDGELWIVEPGRVRIRSRNGAE